SCGSRDRPCALDSDRHDLPGSRPLRPVSEGANCHREFCSAVDRGRDTRERPGCMEGSIVGRDEELAAISEFLAARGLLPARLTLVGEPGIGKTSLWKRGVWIAREAGYRVLASAPTVGESWLAHAVLGDLFEGSLEQTLPKLPLPQRRTVEVALLLADAGDEEINRRALGLALLGSL